MINWLRPSAAITLSASQRTFQLFSKTKLFQSFVHCACRSEQFRDPRFGPSTTRPGQPGQIEPRNVVAVGVVVVVVVVAVVVTGVVLTIFEKP